MRTIFFVASLIVLALIATGAYFWPPTLWVWVIVGPLIGLGMYDACQTQHAVLRNFPLLGHGRYLMEMIRPEVSQYFIPKSATMARSFPLSNHIPEAVKEGNAYPSE